jgi:hypothetical protein
MTILFVVIAVAVIALAAVAASGKLGQLTDPVVDRQPARIPPVPLAASQLVDLRFATAARGYRMQDVDEAIEALTETLRIREAQLSAMSATSGQDMPEHAAAAAAPSAPAAPMSDQPEDGSI